MTREQMLELRAALGRSQRGFAADLGIAATTLRRYEAGDEPVPRTVAMAAELIRSLAARRIMEIGDLQQ
jgi:transcriptional regulator with XRE-family HTH domain